MEAFQLLAGISNNDAPFFVSRNSTVCAMTLPVEANIFTALEEGLPLLSSRFRFLFFGGNFLPQDLVMPRYRVGSRGGLAFLLNKYGGDEGAHAEVVMPFTAHFSFKYQQGIFSPEPGDDSRR